MVYTTSKLKAEGVEYWLDYGSLLGAYRDKKIVPWEFDVDLGTIESNCDKIRTLKDDFYKEKHYMMYDREDYIPQKAQWGYKGTITMPCIRIYDSTNNAYYVDIYWYRIIKAQDILNDKVKIFVPDNYHTQSSNQLSHTNSQSLPQSQHQHHQHKEYYKKEMETEENKKARPLEDLVCNYEGYSGELPGGCRQMGVMFPLSSMMHLGVEMPIPNNPAAALRLMYGDDFMTPTPKGYKALVCNWLSQGSNSTSNLTIILLALICFGFFLTILYRTYFANSVDLLPTANRYKELDRDRSS